MGDGDDLGSFAGRVKGLRKARNLTQVQLAKRAGINQATLSDIERRKTTAKSVTASTILGLARVLETNPNYLRTGKDSPVQPEPLTVEESEVVALYRDLVELNPELAENTVSHLRAVLTAQKAKPARNRPFKQRIKDHA